MVEAADCIDRNGNGGFLSYFTTGLKIQASRQFRLAERPFFRISICLTIQELGQLRPMKGAEKGKQKLFDAIGTQLVVEIRAADFEQFGRFQSISRRLLEGIDDPGPLGLCDNLPRR